MNNRIQNDVDISFHNFTPLLKFDSVRYNKKSVRLEFFGLE